MSFLQRLFGPPNVKELESKGDVEGLIKALGYKKDRQVQFGAARALGKIGDARAVEPPSAPFEEEGRAGRRTAPGGRRGDRSHEALLANGPEKYPLRRCVRGLLAFSRVALPSGR